jgi:hypothetical protein
MKRRKTCKVRTLLPLALEWLEDRCLPSSGSTLPASPPPAVPPPTVASPAVISSTTVASLATTVAPSPAGPGGIQTHQATTANTTATLQTANGSGADGVSASPAAQPSGSASGGITQLGEYSNWTVLTVPSATLSSPAPATTLTECSTDSPSPPRTIPRAGRHSRETAPTGNASDDAVRGGVARSQQGARSAHGQAAVSDRAVIAGVVWRLSGRTPAPGTPAAVPSATAQGPGPGQGAAGIVAQGFAGPPAVPANVVGGSAEPEAPVEGGSVVAGAPPEEAVENGEGGPVRPEASESLLAPAAPDTHVLDLALQQLLDQVEHLGDRLADPTDWRGAGVWLAATVVVAAAEVRRRRRLAAEALFTDSAVLGWGGPEEAGTEPGA